MTNRSPTIQKFCNTVLVVGAIVIGLAGCSTNSEFVRVRNPFDQEKEIIDRVLNKPVDEDKLPPWKRPEYYGSTDSRTASATLFGEEATEEEKGFFGKSKRAKEKETGTQGEPLSPEDSPLDWELAMAETPVAPADTREVSAEPIQGSWPKPVAHDHDRIPASDGTMNRTTGGNICYRCNGKGFQVTVDGRFADANTCAACGGSGRSAQN